MFGSSRLQDRENRGQNYNFHQAHLALVLRTAFMLRKISFKNFA